MDLIIFMILVGVGFATGTIIERKHFQSIRLRERRHLNLVTTSTKITDPEKNISDAILVSGSVVVSVDYFKRVLAALINITGGRVAPYETLLDRGRREAILRMKESAHAWGAHSIVNMRVQTSTIGNQNGKNSLGMVEVIAYGTAVK
ncbi:MAG: heavy metal-binding domain-containing protein [Bdellovibrionota bacterium]